MDCKNDGDKKPKPIRGGGKDDDKRKSWLPNASGNNLEFNILAGISVSAIGYENGSTTVGLLYFSLGVVTDEDGGVQFYYTTKDQVYIPGSRGRMGGYLSGPAERDYPTSAYGIGVTVSHGNIYGDDFKTDKFLGKGYTGFVGAGPGSVGGFIPHDKKMNYTGVDIGLGVGGPVSMGNVATDTKAIGSRIQLPPSLITTCHMMGQCGMTSSVPPIP